MLRIKIKSLATSFDINKINMISNLNSKFASVNKVEASQTSTLSLLVLTKRKLHKAAAFDKSSKTDWVQRYWNREDKRVTVRQLVIIPYMVVNTRFITSYVLIKLKGSFPADFSRVRYMYSLFMVCCHRNV